VIYVDAFSFALSNGQTEIAKLLIDYGAVDLAPGADAPFMAIRMNDPELFSYLVKQGAQSKKICFIDMEHEIFHAVSTWPKFIKNAGRYTNRAVMWDFD